MGISAFRSLECPAIEDLRMRIRLGVVNFLNTRPLVQAFESGGLDHSFDLIYGVPSRCAERLHSGEADVALIPSIEIARGPEPYEICPGVSIASLGPVRSVLLVLKKAPEEIRSLALDPSSRTAIALSRIILQKQYGCVPRVFQSPPEPDRMLERADAALLIGDSALELDPGAYRVLDLGAAWTELTGLPFVYACWTGRSGVLKPGEVRKLVEARALGVRQIPAIAEAFAASHPFPAAFYAAYLSCNIRYDLGDAELEGLRRFYGYALELGLIEKMPEVRFYPGC